MTTFQVNRVVVAKAKVPMVFQTVSGKLMTITPPEDGIFCVLLGDDEMVFVPDRMVVDARKFMNGVAMVAGPVEPKSPVNGAKHRRK